MSEAFEFDPAEFDESDPCAHVPNPWEVHLFPDSAAAWSVQVTPGSATAKVLALLEPDRLSPAGRVDALVALERLQAWAAALEVRMIAAITDEPHTTALAPKLERGWSKEDVKVALGESVTGSEHRIRTAGELVHCLPDTLTALEEGRLTARHANAVVDTVRSLDDEARHKVEQAVLPEPEQITDPVPTMAAFHRRLRRESVKADPRSAEEKATRAAEDRDVWMLPGQNGMSYVGAPLPAEGAETVGAAVDAKAEEIKLDDDPRTKAQRRADGLVQLCADYLNGLRSGVKIKNDAEAAATRAGTQAPRYHGLRPQIQVTVALSTLLGLDEQPGELDGYGAISADVARLLAADPSGTWRRLVTDELDHLIDYGRTTYKPPADLAQFVIARDRTCRAPGCNRSAAKSDLHHITPWSRSGETNADNLIAACERHHYSVHNGKWNVAMGANGTVGWVSPSGHVYRVPPEIYPVDNTRSKIKRDIDAATSAESDEEAAEDDPPF